MIKQGIVVATDGLMATIELPEADKCASCAKRTKVGACEACPDSYDRNVSRVIAHNKVGAAVGDLVEFGRAPSDNLVFAFLVFALPIIAAVLSYFISVLFINDNNINSKVAVIVFIIATSFACVYSYKHTKSRCDYSISRVIESEYN